MQFTVDFIHNVENIVMFPYSSDIGSFSFDAGQTPSSRAQRIIIMNPTTLGYNTSSSSSLSYIRPQYGLDSFVKGYMFTTPR